MEHTPHHKKPFPRWPLVLTLLLAALVAGGYYAYQKYLGGDKWKPLLQAQLKELVLKSTDNLYHIEYSDFDLNLATGDATLKDFKMIPNDTVYQKLLAKKKAPDNLFTLSVKKLTIKNVGAKKAYKEKILIIDNISIDKPDLTIVNRRLKFNDSVKVGTPKTPYQIISKVFKKLQIDSISLKDISLKYINKSNPITKTTAIRHLDIGISHILIDSLSSQDQSRFYYTRGIEFTLHDYRIATGDSLYYMKVKQMAFSTARRSIVLDNVKLQPRYSKTGFYQKIQRADDRFDLSFNRIAVTDIDLQSFLRDQILYAGLIDIYNGKVEIYHDGRYKSGKKTSKIGKDPHQQLQKVSLDMSVKRLNLHNSDITYSETDATSGYTGVIDFKNTSGIFTNVTNDDDAKKRNPYMTARIKTQFLDEAALTVNFKFNLLARDGAFNYSGSLGHFDGSKLDKLVKPLAMVHVKSADIQKLDFNVDASNYGGKGHLEFYYKNLNVELLKKDTATKQLVRQGFISKIANSFLIDNDNPDKKGNFRPGPIDIKRDPTTSFFSFLYKGLLDGIKPSVGVTKKTEGNINKAVEKVSTAVTKVNGLLDKFKQFKEDRKKRREEKKAAKELKKQQEQQEKDNKEKSPE